MSKYNEFIRCATCFFNGGRMKFLPHEDQVLCLAHPPQLHPAGPDDTARHIVPVTRLDRRCKEWRDATTLETIDDVMER